MKDDAYNLVSSVLLSALPPNVPPSFMKIVSAYSVGSGKKRVVVAILEMFDGLLATVECWNYRDSIFLEGYAHRWIDMEGGDISWNGKAWERINIP